MASSKLSPLQYNVGLVNPDGTPTPYFIQLLQQLYEEKAVTDDLAAAAVPKTRQIIAGAGLTGGGDLSADRTLSASVQAILNLVTTTRGAILYRGASVWSALLPGVSGQFLQTAGAGADPLWAAVAAGGGKTTLASPEGQLSTAWTPAVNNYLMKWIAADSAFTINKIAFMATLATPTAKFQPFVYASPAAPAGGGALLGSGPQVTGAVAGYNEVPLTAPVAVIKGQVIWIGLTVITAALNMTAQAGGMYGFAANGGSSVPANPCPALTVQNVANQIYGFWGV